MKKILSIAFLLMLTGCNQLPSEETISNNTAEEVTEEESNVKTYESTTYDFSFDYPKDWVVEETKIGVNLISPETQKAVAEKTTLNGVDVSIKYYGSVAEEPETKNLGVTTLEELVDKNPMIEVIGQTELGNLEATDVIWGGFGAYYVVLVEKDSHLYEVWVWNAEKKEGLSETEQQILSSFSFTD